MAALYVDNSSSSFSATDSSFEIYDWEILSMSMACSDANDFPPAALAGSSADGSLPVAFLECASQSVQASCVDWRHRWISDVHGPDEEDECADGDHIKAGTSMTDAICGQGEPSGLDIGVVVGSNYVDPHGSQRSRELHMQGSEPEFGNVTQASVLTVNAGGPMAIYDHYKFCRFVHEGSASCGSCSCILLGSNRNHSCGCVSLQSDVVHPDAAHCLKDLHMHGFLEHELETNMFMVEEVECNSTACNDYQNPCQQCSQYSHQENQNHECVCMCSLLDTTSNETTVAIDPSKNGIPPVIGEEIPPAKSCPNNQLQKAKCCIDQERSDAASRKHNVMKQKAPSGRPFTLWAIAVAVGVMGIAVMGSQRQHE